MYVYICIGVACISATVQSHQEFYKIAQFALGVIL